MKYTYILALTLSFISCSGANRNRDEEKLENMLVEDCPKVEVSVVSKTPFYSEIVSNGKVSASNYADIYWDVEGIIDNIFTTNGKPINNGDVIALVESFHSLNTLESARADMESSRLAMYETIIGQGYTPDSDSIPDNILHMAEIKSGFARAKASYTSAQYNYDHRKLIAPISGIVANLKAKKSNKTDCTTPFCRIIDTNSMIAEFSVIENELPLVKVGEPVEITAFAFPEKSWKGKVTEVNPFIENNGMVKVKASINDCADLYEGSNISVRIRKNIGSLMSVPKSAVVLRSNRPVVFKANNGFAQWCYVDVSVENSEFVAIESNDIQEGDTIVVSGNIFLAHNSNINY